EPSRDGLHVQQLGFVACLQAEVECLAEVEYLLYDVSLLVDLDWVNAAISALVSEFLNRGLERFVNFADAVAEDVGEAEENRQLDAARLELINEFFEVNGLVGTLVGMDRDV